MTTRTDDNAVTIDHGIESRHRALWALGDYATVATEVVSPLGPVLVRASGIAAGDRVLDVAAGSGNAAIPAALIGAKVTASDLVPELLERGAALARGLNVRWCEANAEALPFGVAEFDAVMSCVGVMFAPHHQRAADELVRVCRPGGTIGLLSWTPEGFIGQMFATMKAYIPAPPPGVRPPPRWGDADYVRALLGDGITDFVAERRALSVDRFGDGAAFRDFFKIYYGPTISAYRGIADAPDQAAALDVELADLGDRYLAGSSTMEWEYLLVTARRR
ncbi:class I SAM-dependent methyltransferase [Mycobacterium sp.]|uniref:class I SAM-dependent methyltransferase n=1 Tax=Mycobacterium sp. TaxID=1785 RepID=UPI003D0E4177